MVALPLIATGCGSGLTQNDGSDPGAGTSPTTEGVASTPTSEAAPTAIAGVVPGEIQWIEPPDGITEPIAPENPDEPSSLLSAAARTMLRSTWSAELDLVEDPDAGGSSPPLGSGSGRIEHRPLGRIDFHWEDGTSETWREAWMDSDSSYHNVDPVVGLLYALVRSSAGARSSGTTGGFVVNAYPCSSRALQDPLVPDRTDVLCGELTAEVHDGRITSAGTEFPGGSTGVSFTVTDEPVEPVVRPPANEACITTVGIPGWIEHPLSEEYVSVLKRRFELQAASIGFVLMDPTVPTTSLSTDLHLPQFVSYSGCVPTVYPPDGWVLERTDDPPPGGDVTGGSTG